MIDKIEISSTNDRSIRIESKELIIEKLDYYRSLIPKLGTFTEDQIVMLKKDITIFFNLKPVIISDTLPKYLFRISKNAEILRKDKLNFLTEISHILAPPVEKSNYNRCNLPKEQILYCSTDEVTAYWESKPKKGDVISVSYYALKPGAKFKCAVIDPDFKKTNPYSNEIQEVFHIVNDFFIEVFTMPVKRESPIGYLFSAILSSNQLFYPVESDENIQAIMYPSVQRKMNGGNIAIKNNIIFQKYDLIDVTTRFIVEEYESPDPLSLERPIDDLIGSVKSTNFDLDRGKIIYSDVIFDKFELFRYLELSDGKQTRYKNQEEANADLNRIMNEEKPPAKKRVFGRNDKVTVAYFNNGPIKKLIKYKLVEKDLRDKKCILITL